MVFDSQLSYMKIAENTIVGTGAVLQVVFVQSGWRHCLNEEQSEQALEVGVELSRLPKEVSQ